ncbi:RNA-binding protein 48 [Coccinella septempunctata]|uniref:RNA-binding protein 48 n=1 Tax=Coccinella septempunctata TaxID=41139 RepID=UPI001D06EAD8|nr:RNA-binding protein 48 [Coccinella septempunctata]
MQSGKFITEQEKNLKKETPHHKQQELCVTRPAYRQGRKLTAVKVYTVSSESQHLFVYGVPSINLRSELKSLFNKYGEISTIHVVPQQKVELFTECYHVHYKRIQSARIAKRLVDTKSFYGGVLHVCYAPEYETLEETTTKLQQRKKDVLVRLKKYNAALYEKNTVPIDPNEVLINANKNGSIEPETSRKRKCIEIDVPQIYSEEDPILSLKKKQKKNTEEYIAKYASQCPNMNGGLINRPNISNNRHSKKFVPLPLRYKVDSEAKVYGPQLPKCLIDSNKSIIQGSEVCTQKISESKPGGSKDNDRNCNQYNIRKISKNVEKRIIFRNKIQNKIS